MAPLTPNITLARAHNTKLDTVLDKSQWIVNEDVFDSSPSPFCGLCSLRLRLQKLFGKRQRERR